MMISKAFNRTAVFLLMFLSFAPSWVMAEAEPLPAVETYDQLIAAIRSARAASQTRIEHAVEQEKVREAWEIGHLIDVHVLQNKERAEYGKNVVVRLAADLGMDRTELYRMLQFAREYPIVVPAQQLSWSHYQALLAVDDPVAREDLSKKAVKENWTRNRLREEIRKRRLQTSEGLAPPLPLRAEKGALDTYRIVKVKDRLQIDLGFSSYFELPKKYRKKFKEGDIVHATPDSISIFKPATKSLFPLQIFAYRATVLDVTDGDTFWALVDLGFGFTTKQQLRLRGLDAPEMESAEGKEAKAALEKMLGSPIRQKAARFVRTDSADFWRTKTFGDDGEIQIRTVRSDKYDRYLADVWVGETYVNQELINQGFAVQVSE